MNPKRVAYNKEIEDYHKKKEEVKEEVKEEEVKEEEVKLVVVEE
tara:strand:- start:491 stop:622 length:132 start_codon:yes stop_codon:yes gene_type:complete